MPLTESRWVWTILIGLALWIASPFAVPLLAGFALALVSHPIHRLLVRRGLPVILSALVVGFVWAMVFVLPAMIVLQSVLPVVARFQGSSIPVDRILDVLKQLPVLGITVSNHADVVMNWLNQHPINKMVSEVEPLAGHIAGHTLMLIVHTALALIVAVLLLIHGEAIAERVRPHLFELVGVPTMMRLEQVLVSSVRAVVLGMIALVLWDGVLGALMFWLLGLPAGMVFAIALALSSLIPGGSGIVLALAAVAAYTGQHVAYAVIILSVGHIITLSGDYLIKPAVTGANSHAPFLIVLLSILGGVEVMGLIGLIAGPVIVLMLYGMASEPAEVMSKEVN
ncbi:MAG: AI-2E family transporter [Halothiobacillus sp.]